MRSFSAWKRVEHLGGRKPLYSEAGGLPPIIAGLAPCFRVFFKNSRIFPAPLGAAAPRPCFAARCAAYRVFSENSQSLFKTFLSFKSTFASFPACFLLSKILSLLARHGFGLQKFFCGFPDAISGFKRTFVAFTPSFRASKVLL